MKARAAVLVVSLLAIVLPTLHACASRREPPKIGVGPLAGLAEGFVATPSGPLHYVTAGNHDGVGVLFVHGSPGSWEAFEHYLLAPELAARAFLVAADRPGFGLSVPGKAEPSLAAQAAALAPLLDLRAGPWVVVGHSLGGPIAAELAADQPQRVAGLLLLAASLDPDLEKHRWYNRLASYRGVQALLPSDLVTSNRELWPLRRELAALAPRLGQVHGEVLALHGDEDALVPVANAAFARRAFTGASLDVRIVPGAGHLFVWQQPAVVAQAVGELVAKVAAR